MVGRKGRRRRGLNPFFSNELLPRRILLSCVWVRRVFSFLVENKIERKTFYRWITLDRFSHPWNSHIEVNSWPKLAPSNDRRASLSAILTRSEPLFGIHMTLIFPEKGPARKKLNFHATLFTRFFYDPTARSVKLCCDPSEMNGWSRTLTYYLFMAEFGVKGKAETSELEKTCERSLKKLSWRKKTDLCPRFN